jgi:hypothetical protein
MVEKIDLRAQFKHLYSPSAKTAQIVDVPHFDFAMVDGMVPVDQVVAESESFQQALEAVYGIAYSLKFMSKLDKQAPIDYTVMALEGLWWTAAGVFDFEKKEDWLFTLMILQPEHITAEQFAEAKSQLKKKKDNPLLDQLRLESFHEGLCVQIMHLGPYSDEPATISRMRAYAQENGYHLRGVHHEIYLGDPRRAKPEKLRTILRHPVEKA